MMAVKLNVKNLYELDKNYKTETAHYTYYAEPTGINCFRLMRENNSNGTNQIEAVRMPDIYRPYFKKKKWE